MTELPFKLSRRHKQNTKWCWKNINKMIFTDEDYEIIYNEYIFSTNCDLCNKKFTNTKDRQLDHNHETGEIRNIVCCKCNLRKKDNKINSRNTTGYIGINKKKHKNKNKEEYIYYSFYATINNKRKYIKSSTDFDWLVKFAEKWKKENNYYT
jgi:hypothetical protein